MSQDLLCLYQQIRETPALTVEFPEEAGKGRITRLDTNSFSLSSWNMEFSKDTFVEGDVAKDMRLLFCQGEGVEWITGRGLMCLDHNEACFCLSDGSTEKMCYQGNSPFSFVSVSVPVCRFVEMIGEFLPDPNLVMDLLPGRRFTISEAIRRSLNSIGSLELIHSGFEMMRLEGRLLENLSFCLQAALCESDKKRQMHQDDLKAIRALGKRIEEEPASIPDIATLAGEYCMSVSKLTRCFRKVYGVSLHAYVIGARLQKGAELLLNNGISVRDVSDAIGYAKPCQFSSDFRKRFGVLPGEYRLRS
jgi:AraC-like DNA-binding protein